MKNCSLSVYVSNLLDVLEYVVLVVSSSDVFGWITVDFTIFVDCMIVSLLLAAFWSCFGCSIRSLPLLFFSIEFVRLDTVDISCVFSLPESLSSCTC